MMSVSHDILQRNSRKVTRQKSTENCRWYVPSPFIGRGATAFTKWWCHGRTCISENVFCDLCLWPYNLENLIMSCVSTVLPTTRKPAYCCCQT